MNRYIKIVALVAIPVFSVTAYADELSQNDKYYFFTDDNNTSSIHEVDSAVPGELKRVDISAMEVHKRNIDRTNVSADLWEQYMSSKQ